MWDNPSASNDGKVEELPVEIDEEEDLEFSNDLEFSEDFFNKFCEIKIKSWVFKECFFFKS